MLRRLHPEQPETFAFTDANRAWAEAQIAKFPEGRQASAIIPLLWRAQEQEGWLTKPAIETVAEMLDMAVIRVLEVASFYFMFQLQPVGSVAHVQICGTTSCMICGAEDLIAVCKDRIAPAAHQLSGDGRFSWEEVECLGACANAPMAQIGKDYYEDLTAESFAEILDQLARGEVPPPGSRKGRFASEPEGGLTSLADMAGGHKANASVELAAALGDTIARITGDDTQVNAPPAKPAARTAAKPAPAKRKTEPKPEKAKPEPQAQAKPAAADAGPVGLDAPRDGQPDDLKRITGVGPKLEQVLNGMGVYHLDQIAGWTEAEVEWVSENLSGFKGRVTRDNWVSQAQSLVAEDGNGDG